MRERTLRDSPVVITASEPHRPYPHKITERDCFRDALREAEVAEADDALLLTPDGLVAEGTAWNVFWWDGDRLHTPTLEIGVLPGIARARVLELVPRTQQARYPRATLAATTVFSTTAVGGVVAIAALYG